jgi:hypothetical protein
VLDPWTVLTQDGVGWLGCMPAGLLWCSCCVKQGSNHLEAAVLVLTGADLLAF